MYKSCSRCGKIHDTKYRCNVGRVYRGGIERDIRNTHKWHKKAEEIKEASNYLCAICQEERVYTYDNLEVHHITKLKEAPEKLLDNYNLVCLCVEHHKQADNNEIDKDYLIKLAKIREDGTDR